MATGLPRYSSQETAKGSANSSHIYARARQARSRYDKKPEMGHGKNVPLEFKVEYHRGASDYAANWLQTRCPSGARITHSRFGPTQGRFTITGGAPDIKKLVGTLRNQHSVISVERI